MTSSESQFVNSAQLDLAVEVLQTFGELRFVAQGVSMLPSIFPGDRMVVRKASFSDIRAGDVVLYARNDSFCAHRVMYKDDTKTLITRGDAMDRTDAPVRETELLGRVISVVRDLKTIPMSRHSGVWLDLQRWVLRHSDVATACYLHGARFYARCKQTIFRARTKIPEYS